MSAALHPPTGPCHFVEHARIADGIAASHASARRRVIVPIHRTNSGTVQRMLNIIQPGSYVRPHLHPSASGVELVCVLQGAVVLVLFDERGGVTERRMLVPGPATSIADIEAGVWHSYCALEADTVVLEIKAGPYAAEFDKEWSDWAPAEDAPEAGRYLAGLLVGVS